MADSQAGAPKDATTEQRGAVQAGAKRAAGDVARPRADRTAANAQSAAAQKRRQDAIARRVANRKMAAGSTPVAAAAVAAAAEAPTVAEIEGEGIFSVASVMDTEGPTRANELTVMPKPVAVPVGIAAAATEEDEPRDYNSLLLNPGTIVDPFAGTTIYRRDPKTGRLIADNWGEEVPTLDMTGSSSSSSSKAPATPAAPAAAAPAAPSTAVPADFVWTDKQSGEITAPPAAAGTTATPSQQPAPATPAATPAAATTPATPATPVTAPAATTPAPAAAAPTTTPSTPAAAQPTPTTPTTTPAAPAQPATPAASTPAPVATPATPAAATPASQPAAAASTTTITPSKADEPAAAPTTTQQPTPVTTPATPAANPTTPEPTKPATPATPAATPAAAPAAAAQPAAADQPATSAPTPAEPAAAASTEAEDDVIAVPATEDELLTQHVADLAAESDSTDLQLPAPDSSNNAVTAATAAADKPPFTNTPAGAAGDKKPLPVPASRAAAALARRNATAAGSGSVTLPAPTRCGTEAAFTCEVTGLCTARDGCACNQKLGTKAADTSSSCNCNAARGFRLTTQNGIAACAWDLSFGGTKYFEVPRLGTVELPVTLGSDACPSFPQKVISSVDLAAAKPVTCPRDGNFVRLENRRSSPWGTEVCNKGTGGHYVLRTTLRGTDRGECRMVKVTSTDDRSHTVVFKYY
uniref:Uncharacterized protein n=1 Tax=Tetradesmus obliquus TaxID=3088 RepID=A0A383W2Z1_TETOB|eukprot:jgi/Sobl393_1/383/SZX72015.1